LPTRDRRRWAILALLFFSITINLLDRQVLSLVAPLLRDQFRLSNTQYSYIVFGFLLGLTLAQVPAGALIDRRGARFGLAFITIWWSAANALHALDRSVISFSAFRFLLGAGESGNYSAGVKVIGQRFSAREAALAGGIFNTGSVIGALIAPPIVIYIATRHSWQTAFLLPSLLGFLWVIPWLLVADRGFAAAGESNAPPPPFRPLLACRQVWGIMLMRALSGPVNHFYWYWLPEYLRRGRGFSLEQIGIWAGLPYFFGGLGNVAGGGVSSLLIARGISTDRARKAGFFLAVVLCFSSMAVPLCATGYQALALICLASFGIGTFAATWIGAAADLFPQKVLARVTGLAGMAEGTVNMGLTLITGEVIDRYSYFPIFLGAGLIPVLALASLFAFVRRIEAVAAPFEPAKAVAANERE
jgi:ACS family hexuronate transporter-like MFS transporter